MRRKSPRAIKLHEGEYVMAVVPDRCAGPGWSNKPVWVHIANNRTSTFRTECLQPDEQTPELLSVFDIGVAVHAALMALVPTKRIKEKTT